MGEGIKNNPDLFAPLAPTDLCLPMAVVPEWYVAANVSQHLLTTGRYLCAKRLLQHLCCCFSLARQLNCARHLTAMNRLV